jgi:hypothetical protein
MPALWSLFLAGVVSTAVTRRSESENVVLADCMSSSNLGSSQFAYYVGPPDSSPDSIANVRVGLQQPWAGKGLIKASFPDETTFSCSFAALVSEGQFAGIGSRASSEYSRGFTNFSCYARFISALYTTEDGSVCNAIYVCDRSKPPGGLALRVKFGVLFC